MALLAGGGGRGRLLESAKKLRTAGPSPATHTLTHNAYSHIILSYYMCPHTAIYLAYCCMSSFRCGQPYCYVRSCGMPVLIRILLYKKLRNAGLSSATRTPTYFMCPHTALYLACAYYYTCVRILPSMCPHTTICVSAFYYICVRILVVYGGARRWVPQPQHSLIYI